ncbi:MAG: sulfatase-like hydrolase/transferase, partial [Chitinivibrionales bacterium]|nr:sulfatase-like hydrolase/transferase [Chitinivibrionales bacterium]
PNVVFILTDDQGIWAAGCYGNAEIRTPNLDRIAAEGIRFDNFFCTSPVCSPARASILTGRIPSQHGVHDWLCGGNSYAEPSTREPLIEYLAGQPGYTDLLAAQGYRCGLSGKWHLGDAHHRQKGFSYWYAHARGGGDYYYAPVVVDEREYRYETRYITDVITDNAIAFLDQHTGDKPFYLSVHYTAPHSPWGREQHPHEIFEHYHNDCRFASVPELPRHPWGRSFKEFFADPAKRREMLSGYFAATTAMDGGVGRLLDWLEQHNLRDDTLVVFMSDNGMNMGHHGICGKGNGTYPQNMYDTSVKVPCLMSRPGHLPQGTVSRELYSQYDFMPTLLDYLGIDNPDAAALPGTSFAGMLRGEPETQRDSVVVYDEYGPVRMIRSHTHKYVHRYPDGPHELYDLERDPDEERNLIDDRAQRALVDRMRTQLESWFTRYARPDIDGINKPVTGNGQCDRADGPQEGDAPFAQGTQPWWKPGEGPKR